ncbi:Ig-like domain-containing protein [Vibrio vulnificus]|uniref:Ig-like domain-containing protein n=1 Tax=Vibrio vulnificus TaxID=672 RepID=UPI0015930C36|nr:hypothetical protein [Vibrio vulnificus]NVD21483.1 hypothetical protein [Vibrio vulnificus]
MNKLYLVLITVPLTLLGCGGEESSSSAKNDSVIVEQAPLVYTQDGIVRTYTEQNILVDLSDKNTISNNELLEIDEMTNITGGSQCDPASISGMTFELNAFSNPTMCQYQYSLRSVESGETFVNSRMATSVVIQERPTIMPKSVSSLRALPSTTLPPIQLSVSNRGSVVNIDLNSHLASLFPKDSDDKHYHLSSTILVLGAGSAKATTDDLKKSIIEYTSDAYDLGGITRLIYSLTDDFDGDGVGDYRVGAIDISVSSSSGNTNPVTKYFHWTNNGSDIKVGQKYTIDVTEDISEECIYGREPGDKKGSCIYDADNDTLQIVGVYAYDATVTPTSLTILDNTSLDVTFNRTGIHDINYQVYDHAGGFATGIVRVVIAENQPPVLKQNPMIVYATENSIVDQGKASSHAIDLEGDSLSYKSFTQPDSGKVSVSVYNNGSLAIRAQPDSEGVHSFDVVITDGQNDVVQNWVYIVNSSSYLSLKDISERTFSTNVNTPITIDVRSLIQGYFWTDESDSVTVTNTAGALLGSVAIDDTEKYKIVYTPTVNKMGADDFVFEVRTAVGATIAGNVIIHVGNPPALEITSVDATEGEDDLITASVTCEHCDVSQYVYEWLINGETVSREKSFTITPEQRIYDVTLLVIGYDVFGQVAYELSSFDFFKIVAGSFDHPAADCQEIFAMYNSPYALKVDDGEYWLRSADNTYTYKTQCDMVSQAEAEASDKTVGGYTLVWSYSEKSNLQRFGGNTNVFSQRGKGVAFDGSLFTNGRGLVKTKSGTVNYNDFRVTNSEMRTKYGLSHSRVSYTSDPSVETINRDPDKTVQNWYMQTTQPVAFYSGGISFESGGYRSDVFGKLDGKHFSGKFRSSRAVDLSDDNGSSLGDMTVYGGGYGFHYTVDEIIYGQFLNNFWGFWGENDHQLDLFGVCTNPSLMQLGGVVAYGCNGDDSGAKTYHAAINNGEGYVIQWWAH